MMREILAELMNSALENINDASDETVKTTLEDLLQAIAAVISDMKVESYPADTVLCHAGVVEDMFYVIARGGVDVWLPLDGERKKVATKGPGEFFGEMALVLDQPRSADVITTEDSIVLELNRRSFKRAMRISEQLATLMSQRTTNQFDENRLTNLEAQQQQLAPFQVFTSYSRDNQEFVFKIIEELRDDLRVQNITLWLDQTHIAGGTDWDTAIDSALRTCDAMLLVISESAMESNNVKAEWNRFLNLKKPIIPVLCEECEVNFRLDIYQQIDFVKQARANALAQVHTRILQLADSSR